MTIFPPRRSALLLFSVLGLSLATCGATQPPADDSQPVTSGQPQPLGSVRRARPRLSWPCRPRDGRRVDSVQATVDGQSVPAHFDPESASVIAEPGADLATGAHDVALGVTLSDGYSVEQTWRFEVRAPAPPAPSPDSDQRAAVASINTIRHGLGLPEMRVEPQLCWAALRHSRYLRANGIDASHDETAGAPLFSGATPSDRAIAAGYDGPCFELVARDSTLSADAVAALLAAPYHRGALIQPGASWAGAGRDGDRTTVLCAIADERAMVAYPGDGQTGVPVRWDNHESPDPLRLHGDPDGPFGYPVTLHAFGEERLHRESVALTDAAGRAVECFVNDPENDDLLTDTIILIPKKPLQSKTTYRAHVIATVADGRRIERSWVFTTK